MRGGKIVPARPVWVRPGPQLRGFPKPLRHRFPEATNRFVQSAFSIHLAQEEAQGVLPLMTSDVAEKVCLCQSIQLGLTTLVRRPSVAR